MSVLVIALVSMAAATQGGLRQTAPATVPAYFGAQIAFTGDLDRDGWSEIAVTMPHHDTDRGRVIVYSLRTSDVWLDVTGHESGEELGQVLWAGHDVDGDGWNDVVVSVNPLRDGARRRAVRALSGRDGRELFTLLVPLVPPRDFGAGAANVWLADRDGDGCAEVCAYDPRSNTIVSGRSHGELRFAGNAAFATRTGRVVARTLIRLARDLDVDGDGWNDLAYAETVESDAWVVMTDAEFALIDRDDPPADVEIHVENSATRLLRTTTRRVLIVSGEDGATLRTLELLADDDPREVLSAWCDLGPLDELVRGLAAVPNDELTLHTGHDLDGDGVNEWLHARPDHDDVRIVSGADVRSLWPWSDCRVLRVLRPPPLPPTGDPYALGRSSLNRANRR